MGAVQQVLASYGAIVDDTAFSGALVRLSTAQTPAPLFTWDTEVYDTDAWHSTASNTHRMTVPADTSVIRLISASKGNNTAAEHTVQQERQGSAFYGQGFQRSFESPRNPLVNAVSALIEVSLGDWFNQDGPSNNAAVADEATWFAVERVRAATKRCLVRKSSTQSISAGTTTALTWDTEVYDVGGWFDSGVSTTSFTVPSGTSGYIRITAGYEPDNLTGQQVISIRKGGVAGTIGCATKDTDCPGLDVINVGSAVLAVSEGDTFDVTAFSTNAAVIQATESTWFCIEEVLNFHGCLAYKDASQALSAGVETALSFAAESYDTDGAHDNVTNNTRITVPIGSGFTRARASFAYTGPSVTGGVEGRVLKNGSAFYGSPHYNCDTAGTDNLGAYGAWVDVSEGDYFELFIRSTSAATVPIDNRTWLCVEFQ